MLSRRFAPLIRVSARRWLALPLSVAAGGLLLGLVFAVLRTRRPPRPAWPSPPPAILAT